MLFFLLPISLQLELRDPSRSVFLPALLLARTSLISTPLRVGAGPIAIRRVLRKFLVRLRGGGHRVHSRRPPGFRSETGVIQRGS